MAATKSALEAYVTGSPALYSCLLQPSVVFLATLQEDVISVAGAVYDSVNVAGSCMRTRQHA